MQQTYPVGAASGCVWLRRQWCGPAGSEPISALTESMDVIRLTTQSLIQPG
jgi:hypothetical protein